MNWSFLTHNKVRAAFIYFFSFMALISISTATNAGSASVTPTNPWHAITDFEMDPDHGHLYREASPFDDLNQLQLAAIPKGQRIHFNAPSKCVPARLKSVLRNVAAKFGPITVNSTYRSPAKNRKIGGRSKSLHLSCAAVDFRVHGSTNGVLNYLKNHSQVGGYKRYRSGFYHIDTGPKRTWR
ncbi:MAG: D-Ala-D-Ala carboxypeptidase family metallohydrolase [Ahrensia sp.]|nr:D-Ala-D-Ala carboxypeptidase family metallohydrolase [Ahrensia sp.]